MTKIFHKIRRRFLAERQLSKYLAYAFGEIILVVIGILIALQINNWNESRKTQAIAQQLLRSIQNEFENNLRLITDFEKELVRRNTMATAVINFSAKKPSQLPIDSLRYFAAKMFFPQRPLLTNSSIKEAISSCTFGFLENKLSVRISTFEDYLEGYLESLNSREDFSSLPEQRKLPLNLAVYQQILVDYFPQKDLAVHPDFDLNDEQFVRYIQEPDTYSVMMHQFMTSASEQLWIVEIKKSLQASLEQIEKI